MTSIESPARHDAGTDSFYHLRGCSLSGSRCRGTACFVAQHLKLQPEPDIEQDASRVYCFGECFRAPVLGPGCMRPHMEIQSREPVLLERLVKGGARELVQYRKSWGYRASQRAFSMDPDAIVNEIGSSALRGRGGAAFPTVRKWRTVGAAPGTPKYIIANADEGDAGAYMDRFLIEDDPFALIEGMTIAARAVGASKGFIYLRAEYPAAYPILMSALAEARAAGLLGAKICGEKFDFDIEITMGRGSYVCGEETALIRSIEGRRPEVMARPPYPTDHGLFGKPTLINNVETFCSVPWILNRGGSAYRNLGFSESRGTKLVSLNSLFQKPGLYEVEFGVTVRHICEDLGGGLRDGARLKGIIIGGPLAGVIPPELLDTAFGFEELRAIGAGVGHGGIVAFDEHTSIPALMHHVSSFGAYESCGKCTPCRLGSRQLEGVFESILHGVTPDQQTKSDCKLTIAALKLASLCGHGIGLGEFAESILRHYGKELEPCFQ